ncbi:SMI1/KNR4 family protein [Gilvimarinus sp. SDUM040013]|uniref:SMI1/KNR4 family protein n=1 Tax=Gilvimarinus gilvus TaxID=3058038 RepID=A0ABU4RW08_9GAMM|nr:SMI1/KNR4 family protein [Gilvimarinus sp. SDUM040013]MDO3388303.1 SMI1/KNR4 family protein [Gilvimarinus sp. SDUM040013]MDX6847853.1 SMI1/KNR4 family protein [Gilvimarinus sp. SDUM040013]
MEDVIDDLKSSAESVPVPLELPDDDTLVLVEEEILLPIPRDMREYLLTASDVIYGALEPVTAADPYSHTYLPEVAASAWARGVPRHLVPLCESHGHYYCVEPDGEVVFWRDGDLSDERWQSVWHWVRDVWLES